jgi:hypothetical protein
MLKQSSIKACGMLIKLIKNISVFTALMMLFCCSVSRTNRLERIKQLVNDVSGIALVAYADIEKGLLPFGERDSTNDITNMARTDHIWGNSIALGLAATAKWIAIHGLLVKNIDVYYDTRSIKVEHRQALTGVDVKTLSSIIKDVNSPVGYNPNFRRFNDTPKAKDRGSRDKFQSGIWVADRLLQEAQGIIELGDLGRIHARDNSKIINDYLIQNFSENDGSSKNS